MPQPDCEPPGREPAGAGPGGSITDRLLAHGGGLDRLCAPLGTRYAGWSADAGGGGFSKYPGWDEQPHPWSQRAGGGDRRAAAGVAAGAGAAKAETVAERAQAPGPGVPGRAGTAIAVDGPR